MVLLEAGASLSIVDKQGETPLHWAVEMGHKDVTKVLLEAGASLSTVGKQGETPLHWAAFKGHKSVTEVLLEAGASLSTVDKQGHTPYDLANRDIKQLIKIWNQKYEIVC